MIGKILLLPFFTISFAYAYNNLERGFGCLDLYNTRNPQDCVIYKPNSGANVYACVSEPSFICASGGNPRFFIKDIIVPSFPDYFKSFYHGYPVSLKMMAMRTSNPNNCPATEDVWLSTLMDTLYVQSRIFTVGDDVESAKVRDFYMNWDIWRLSIYGVGSGEECYGQQFDVLLTKKEPYFLEPTSKPTIQPTLSPSVQPSLKPTSKCTTVPITTQSCAKGLVLLILPCMGKNMEFSICKSCCIQ